MVPCWPLHSVRRTACRLTVLQQGRSLSTSSSPLSHRTEVRTHAVSPQVTCSYSFAPHWSLHFRGFICANIFFTQRISSPFYSWTSNFKSFSNFLSSPVQSTSILLFPLTFGNSQFSEFGDSIKLWADPCCWNVYWKLFLFPFLCSPVVSSV